ncbi:MAG: hypothetical protein ACP5JO_03385, partial [Candidatus Ratteibacteria bacterium]
MIRFDKYVCKRLQSLVLITILVVLCLTGCATFTPSKEVFSRNPNLNVRTYDAPVETCWLAARQALLKNNFSIYSEDSQLK